MTAGLTKMQSRALVFIKRYFAENGFSPSYEECMCELGLASRSSVHRILVALEERGAIRRQPGRARGIEIVEPADFHLRRMLDAMAVSGFLRNDDPIAVAARAAMGEDA